MAREGIFRFKQFSVHNSKSAMKVGTDGVLIGAWCDVTGAKRILDVGTGTGLVAMMLAQRSEAEIDAIDIDGAAVEEATLNFAESPWAARLRAYKADFNELAGCGSAEYDLVVSNPPYFTNSLVSPERCRTLARHAASLSVEDLISCAFRVLGEKGRLVVIYPSDNLPEIRKCAVVNALNVAKICWVKPTPDSEAKRVLVELTKESREFEEMEIVIEKSRGVYDESYVEMTKEFYLKF